MEGDPEEHGIGCLNKTEYRYSEIQQDKLTTENGEIIGLVHVVKNFRCDPSGSLQKQLRYDVLFRLNPETGGGWEFDFDSPLTEDTVISWKQTDMP